MGKKQRIEGFISAVLATAFMGSLGIFVKQINLDAGVLTFFRLLFSALFMLVLIMVTKSAPLVVKPSMPLIFSGLALAANVIFYIASIKLTSMSTAVFLLYTGPIFATVGAFLFLKEPFGVVDLGCLLLSMVGILFLVHFRIDLASAGIFYGILSGLSYGLLILFNRMIEPSIPIKTRGFLQFMIGSLALMPLVAPHIRLQQVAHWFVGLLAMAFTCGFLGIGLMFNAIAKLKAVEYGVLAYMEVVFATLFGILVFGEGLSLWSVAGGCAILTSGIIQITKRSSGA